MNIVTNHFKTYSVKLLFLLFSCIFCRIFSQGQEQQIQKSILLAERTLALENIAYKTSDVGDSLLLDIYTPKQILDKKLPVVLYIHGGGWAKGNKTIRANSYIENTILKLVEKQYTVVSIDYTLINEHSHFPIPIQDCKDAIRWIRKNAEKYHFDAKNIGLFGTSAGAHLSLLAAYTRDNEFVGAPELSQYSAEVNYVVDNFGPTDLNKIFHTRAGKPTASIIKLFSKEIIDIREKLIQGMSGYDIKKDKRKIIEYFNTLSPLNYTSRRVPTFILQGNKDKIVPLQQSKKLYQQLTKENIQTSLIIVNGGNHGFRTTSPQRLDELTDAMVNFIISQKK
ncbi:alpha/beta hydrolase [Chryseobacterium potabilaquae]|uniref:Carboxylesterase NlhH n=1 Tax=Chryseobacterium potabilaquae TaxID=2675057 RepID=A0A6N4XDJ8_9FLAO|nr:alpha/beta hydrolase [Chryseobacterium potabilaquae]CAA7197075.1 Carboxylesterase NlhH [Chryseobacterium potabilaquae]